MRNLNLKIQYQVVWVVNKNCESLSRDLNTGPADYKSAALPTKPLRRHILYSLKRKKDGAHPTVSIRLGIVTQ